MDRERLVNRDLNPLLSTLPAKFTEIYDYQIDAISEVVEAFDGGEKVVVLDAPTGSGKTLIAECVRRMIRSRGVYVCHNKELQAQFAGDFRYSAILMGRSNYRPSGNRPLLGATCEDCTWTSAHKNCVLCEVRADCPYVVARDHAVHSPIPVLNSAYWLNETQSKWSRFRNAGLTVLDEADTLEGVLMGQVEIRVSPARRKQFRVPPPSKMTKEHSYAEWGENLLVDLLPAVSHLENRESLDVKATRELRGLQSLVQNVRGMVDGIQSGGEGWVYTGGAGSDRRKGEEISFKPLKVARWGEERIWSKGKRFLLMSGTVISPGMLVGDLGWDGEYRTVRMESQFHAKNRQVVVRPVADMTRKGASEQGARRLERAVRELSDAHGGDRILVHTVSYTLAQSLHGSLRPGGRHLYTYSNARERAAAITGFKNTPGAILVAPSADRGVDLPDDLCRVQIIAKVPYLSLGDRQTSERLYNTPDGKIWYNVQVARSLMQMVGRAVRSTDDWAVCYILDSNFVKWYKAWGHLFPKWFRKGIRFEQV